MAQTTRDIIVAALRNVGAIDIVEAPESNEIDIALNELNGIIDSLNTENLWPYTQIEVTGSLTGGKSQYTIGKSPELNIVSAISSPLSGTNVNVTTDEYHTFSIGDNIIIDETTQGNASGTFTVTSIGPGLNQLTIAGNPNTSANDGIIYNSTDVLPDIKTNFRPQEIYTFTITDGDVILKLCNLSNKDFNNSNRAINNNTRPTIYRYRPDNTYGLLELYPIPDQSYPYTISYRNLINDYELNDEINLPPGYAGFLQYELARILGINYGMEKPSIAQESAKRLARIKRQNYEGTQIVTLTPVSNRHGKYNVYADIIV
jgi:hypothetical protein